MKTIDDKTMEDVVGLIEKDVRAKCISMDYTGESLALVILGRLGYETPKPSCLPDVTQGKWHVRPVPGHSSTLYIYADDTPIVSNMGVGGNATERPHNALLIAHAPKLAEAGNELVGWCIGRCQNNQVMPKEASDMLEALREAGVDI
jgi:hypothetical protein